jgi:hypothetical protein
MAKKSTPDLDPTKLISEGYVEQSDYWYNPKTKQFIYKDNYISGEGAPYSYSPFNSNYYKDDPFTQYHGLINNDNLGGNLNNSTRAFNPEYNYQYAGEDASGLSVYNINRYPSKSRQQQITDYYSSSLTPKSSSQIQTPPNIPPVTTPLQKSTPQTIGEYTGLSTNNAPMQPLPTLPQTFSPTIGNPNFPVLSTPPSTFGIPTQPTATLGGKTFTPQTITPQAAAPAPSLYNTGNFDANLQSAMKNAAAGSTGGVGGAISKAGGLLSKANPYLAAGTAILGGAQALIGAIGLARSRQPQGYKEVPEMARAIGEAEQDARFGLGSNQLALARQQGRENINTQMYNARNLSPNMAGILSRMNVGSSLMAGNQLAAQDFAAQQQKVGIRNQLYGTRQRLADANTQLAQQNYARQQEAYGGALRSGLTNLGSFFNLNQALKYNPSIT